MTTRSAHPEQDTALPWEVSTGQYGYPPPLETTAPPAVRRARKSTVAVCTGAVLGVATLVGGALGIARVLDGPSASCSQLATAAGTPSAAGADHVDLVIGVAGNSGGFAAEVAAFISDALATARPGAKTVVNVTLVSGDHAYQPAGASCVGRDLLLSAADHDIDSYHRASAASARAVADSLTGQYQAKVAMVATAVSDTVSAAPRPKSGDAGAFSVWPFVSDVAADHRVGVLDTFAVGGNNCLTMTDPASSSPKGSTIIEERVTRCVAAGEVANAQAAIQLIPITSLDLTAGQRKAQRAVVTALCQHATAHGCASNPDTSDKKETFNG